MLFVFSYLALTLLYSLVMKNCPVIELIWIAFGFILRPLAGAAIFDISVSKWFMLVIAFGSLFIVSCKRISEFKARDTRRVRKVLSTYTSDFLHSVMTSSMSVILVSYSLWVFEIESQKFIGELSMIPLVCILFRYTWLTENGDTETPELQSFKDVVILSSIVSLVICYGVIFYL
jgi:decaprenyl-phosphate phosphoribosyltransferase